MPYAPLPTLCKISYFWKQTNRKKKPKRNGNTMNCLKKHTLSTALSTSSLILQRIAQSWKLFRSCNSGYENTCDFSFLSLPSFLSVFFSFLLLVSSFCSLFFSFLSLIPCIPLPLDIPFLSLILSPILLLFPLFFFSLLALGLVPLTVDRSTSWSPTSRITIGHLGRTRTCVSMSLADVSSRQLISSLLSHLRLPSLVNCDGITDCRHNWWKGNTRETDQQVKTKYSKIDNYSFSKMIQTAESEGWWRWRRKQPG